MKKLAAALALCALIGTSSAAYANHPHLRKLAEIAGVGALTGGVGAMFMGTGVATGAAVGAGTHVGFHEAHHWWQRHRTGYRAPGRAIDW